MNREEYIGYLKYSGSSIEHGLLDTRKSAEALLGFDEILRYFVAKEDPELKEVDFEIPVRIKKGSWEIWIPVVIASWFAKDYISAVAKKAGSDGFFETGPVKDIEKIFRGALKAAQWMIQIASHTGTFTKKQFENVKIEQGSRETYIKIPNSRDEYLDVPKKYFDLFAECPESLFSKNAEIVEEYRILELGVFENGREEKASITIENKSIFYIKSEEEEDGDIVLPELKHGQTITLEGMITRATESVNTIGFQYKDHVIICKPQSGGIVQYKAKIVSKASDHVFSKAKITGTVDRTDKFGGFKEKRPTIVFTEIISLENGDKKKTLFDDHL